MMNALIMNTLHIPSYFNAGHHLAIFEVGAYLRKHLGREIRVNCLDVGALNATWKELSDKLFQQSLDLVAIMVDYDTSDNLQRLLYYIRQLSPNCKIILFGRLCRLIPRHFRRYGIDAVAVCGDDESSVASYVDYLIDGKKKPVGCHIRQGKTWIESESGIFLDPDQWVFPDIREIPYDAYCRLYADDSNKFCGIPQKRELCVHVSRGCPVGCDYCEVSAVQGKADRRIDAVKLYDYVMETVPEGQFDYVSMYSPIFTLNREWTENFCNLMINGSVKYPWKCVSTAEHLTQPLIEKMAAAFCVRISVGIENIINNQNTDVLPDCKRNKEEQIKMIGRCCQENGIELNCFLMLGIPGLSASDVRATIDLLRMYGARIRPTIYTRYQNMCDSSTSDELFYYNRQLFDESCNLTGGEREEFYRIIYGGTLGNTTVYEKF